MIYAKPLLAKVGKRASDFLFWLNDERKNHNLEKFKGRDMIKLERNGGGGSEIHIHCDLKYKLDEFIEENKVKP